MEGKSISWMWSGVLENPFLCYSLVHFEREKRWNFIQVVVVVPPNVSYTWCYCRLVSGLFETIRIWIVFLTVGRLVWMVKPQGRVRR